VFCIILSALENMLFILYFNVRMYLSSKGADVVQHGVGVAVEVWCRDDDGGQAPSGLTPCG